MADLFDRLQATLGEDAYKLELELGGGGMSQVFLATEVELGRKVVIKVLPPDMAAGVNKERFQREIKLAASLQHPHIVPLLTAGSAGDLLWYIMPFIEGESLRQKLAREGEMPIGQATDLLKEVSDALAYAHAHKVVHRDIKPDNVMLSGGHAVVTDFGVAKAVSASSGGTHSSLTSMGVALGTPAYMSPEQAAADPHVDHRADIYAVGALAYEMLTGRPPFVKQTPQQILAAHVNEAPEPVTSHRGSVPAEVAGTIMRCLAKRAADRWQTADELKTQFSAAFTPDSGGMTPTGTQPTAAYTSGTAALKMFVDTPLKLAAVFLGAVSFLLLFVYALVIAFGLPFWVFYGGVMLAAIGFPIVMMTGRRERQIIEAHTTGLQMATPVGIEKHLTWRKALTGGGFAFAGLAVVAGGFMGMKSAGIGPAATLVSSGALGERDLVILAQFDNRTPDETLGSTVTELLRIGLGESVTLRLAEPRRISESLARMALPDSTTLTAEVAQEIAERETIKAYIAGEVVPLGDGFVVSARVIAANGEVLTGQQASAASAGDLVNAVGELSDKIRERVGESLRIIRKTLPLELVTTGSLRSLRLYTQALQAEIAGDQPRALTLLEEAIVEDSLFAMAYRKISTILANNLDRQADARAAVTRAYELRDRLSELERGYTVAGYHTTVTGRRDEALAAYRTILEKFPEDDRSLNNSGVLYSQLGNDSLAAVYYSRAIESADSTWSTGFTNLAFIQRGLGDIDEAERTLDLMAGRFPNNPQTLEARARNDFARRDYDAALDHLGELERNFPGNPNWQLEVFEARGFQTAMMGRFSAGSTDLQRAIAAFADQGSLEGEHRVSTWWEAARLNALGPAYRPPPEWRTRYREALAQIPTTERWYEYLMYVEVASGNLDAARLLAENIEQSGLADLGLRWRRDYDRAMAWFAVGEGRYEDAIRSMRAGTDGFQCQPCGRESMARVFDAANMPDSAAVYWELFAENAWGIAGIDMTGRPHAYRRLGEIYEQRGETEQAAAYYSDFVDLWDDADVELQPQVTDVRQRLARLVGKSR